MVTIVINRSESYCSRCRKDGNPYGALPYEDGHYTYVGWGGSGDGCGAPWTAVSTDYAGREFDTIGRHYFGFDNLRGLPVVSMYERMGSA